MQGHNNALKVSDLTVHYGKRVAVDSLSLELAPGEIVALLGPNGAGKSTSLLAIAGALMPSRGTITIAGADLGSDPLAARARVGFADQPPSLYEFYTVAEHLAFVGETRGGPDGQAPDGQKPDGQQPDGQQPDGQQPDGQQPDGQNQERQAKLLGELGLGKIAGRLCRELSFGMRQRVGLAAALVGDVAVVLLDETLNGLDPRAAKLAREALTRAAERGVAILMSTHLLGVAERLCQRILVMDQGKLKADVAGDELGALLDKGPGAVEELYLSLVTSGEAM